jgi:ABC-type Fe3+-hydroxamate transport system substrate-binding protein
LFFRPFVLTVVAAGALLGAACGARDAGQSKMAGLDDYGDTIRSGRAQRIVSLNPVTTEIFFAIGAGKRLVGRTHWDLYPPAARAVPDLGSAMPPNVEAVLAVHPDLVVLYAGNMNRVAAQKLRQAGIATIALRTDHIADLRRTLLLLGQAVGDSAAGALVADSVDRTLDAVRALPRPARPPRVYWRIWDQPLMTIGRGSYMSELVEIVGAINIFDDLKEPSPQISMEELVRRNPDYILTGPVSAKTFLKSDAYAAVPAVRAGRILIVDTALVGRPGPRLGEAARHLRALIVHDTVH